MKIHYKVVEHDGGWAYKLGDVFSEASPDRATALAAAKRVAAEQHVPGSAAYIEYQDEACPWHTEFSAGDDRWMRTCARGWTTAGRNRCR